MNINKNEFDTMPTMKLNELKEAERIKISLLKYIYKSTKGRYYNGLKI